MGSRRLCQLGGRTERETASPDMLTGPASLAERTKRLKRKILVCMTDRRSRLGDVEVVPIRERLAELPA
jgi:hypothetical protein